MFGRLAGQGHLDLVVEQFQLPCDFGDEQFEVEEVVELNAEVL